MYTYQISQPSYDWNEPLVLTHSKKYTQEQFEEIIISAIEEEVKIWMTKFDPVENQKQTALNILYRRKSRYIPHDEKHEVWDIAKLHRPDDYLPLDVEEIREDVIARLKTLGFKELQFTASVEIPECLDLDVSPVDYADNVGLAEKLVARILPYRNYRERQATLKADVEARLAASAQEKILNEAKTKELILELGVEYAPIPVKKTLLQKWLGK